VVKISVAEEGRVVVGGPAVEAESERAKVVAKDLDSTVYALGIATALLKNTLIPDLTLVLVP